MKRFKNLAAGAMLGLCLACGGQQTSMPLQVPDVELSLDPAALIIAPGTTGNLTLTVRPRDGFTGTVDLVVDPKGSGQSATVTPTALTIGGSAATAIVFVRVPETAQSGDRELVLRATGTFGQRDLPFRITVPTATLLPVHTHINASNVNLPFMVFKDGDAPWRPLEGTDGSYQAAVTDPAGRYGLAYGYICAIGAFHSNQMNYIFQTLAESVSLDVTFICDPPPGPGPTLFSLEGRLAGQGSDSGFLLTSAGALFFQGASASYHTQVLKGTGDLAGWTFADEATRLPTRFFLERGRNSQSDATRDVDFAAEGFAPGPVQSIAYGSVGSDESLQGAVRYFTAGGQYVELGGGVSPQAYAAFPAERGQSGDSYSYGFAALAQEHSEVVYGGGAAMPGPLAIQFPTPVPPFTVSWPQGAYFRPATRWTSVLPEPRVQQMTFWQRVNQDEVYWFSYYSAGWLGTGEHAVEMPDFSGFAGWNPAWGFRAGAPVSVNLGQFGTLAGGSANGKGELDDRGKENTEKSIMDWAGKQDQKSFIYPLPLKSGPIPSAMALLLGSVEGRFRIQGLAAPKSAQATQPGDSFSATRQQSSMP